MGAKRKVSGGEQLDSNQYQRLCRAKAEAQELQNRVLAGELVKQSDVDKAESEAAEIIRNDLGYALPSLLSSALSGRVFTAAEVKRISLDIIREMIKRWHDGGQIKKTAIPE